MSRPDIHAAKRGAHLMRHRRYGRAEKELREGLAQSPDSAILHAMLATCLNAQQRYEEARQVAARGVHLGPEEARCHVALAEALYRSHRDQEAEAAIREALRLAPDDTVAFSLLALLFVRKLEFESAVEAARSGLAVDSKSNVCFDILIESLVALGRTAEADEAIRNRLSSAPETASVHAWQGARLHEERDAQLAEEHLREALRLNPNSEKAREVLVEVLKEQYFACRLLLGPVYRLSRLDPQTQSYITLGVSLAALAALWAGKNSPWLPYLLLPLVFLVLLSVMLRHLGEPLFDTLLRFTRPGRRALTRRQMLASNYLLAGCMLMFGAALAYLFWPALSVLTAATYFAMMTVATTRIYRSRTDWVQLFMFLIAFSVLLVGGMGVVLALLSDLYQMRVMGLSARWGGWLLLGMCWFTVLFSWQLVKDRANVRKE